MKLTGRKMRKSMLDTENLTERILDKFEQICKKILH